MSEKKQVEKYTRYEKARILGNRALQIAMGAPFLVTLTDEDLQKLRYNPIEIAKMEFDKGLIQVTIGREVLSQPLANTGKKQTAEHKQ